MLFRPGELDAPTDQIAEEVLNLETFLNVFA